MRLTEAFKTYGATLKNVNWSVSAENTSGELVLSLWTQYFDKSIDNTIRYSDRVTRWHGHGNKEFRDRIKKAYSTGQTIRAVLARTNDEMAVADGKDASKLKNTFFVKEDWLGKVIVWNGDDFVIEFNQRPSNS